MHIVNRFNADYCRLLCVVSMYSVVVCVFVNRTIQWHVHEIVVNGSAGRRQDVLGPRTK